MEMNTTCMNKHQDFLQFIEEYFDGLTQDNGNSSALTMGLSQCSAKPLIMCFLQGHNWENTTKI